ncbi:MAG: DNA replication/repair protein RecF, partial [Albidovulum sp.]|nr:DNA replication/repair protein RecF [Albidovulum sp.]
MVVLSGPIGAGKTNALVAISLFSPGRGLRSSSAEEISRRPGEIGWKVAGRLVSPHREIYLETYSRESSPRRVAIDGKPAKLSDLARTTRILWLTPVMDRLWIESAAGRRRFLDRISMSFFPDHANASIGYDKAMRERNRLLKDKVSNDGWYDALEIQMARHGSRISANRIKAAERINEAQSDSLSRFPVAKLSVTGSELEGSRLENEDDLSAILKDCRPRDLAAGRSLAGPHRADLETTYASNGLPARNCSTGEQKALLVSIVLANARALSGDLGISPVLLLDEVSAHLDESRRAALYEEILSLRLQAWVTGTDISHFEKLIRNAQHFSVV